MKTALALVLVVAACGGDTGEGEPSSSAGSLSSTAGSAGTESEGGPGSGMDTESGSGSQGSEGGPGSGPDTGSGGETGTTTSETTGPPPGLWTPAPGTSWQWQLTETIDTSVEVDVYDIDLFDAPQSVIDELHAAGRIVICYFSAGSYEEWRDDADAFPDGAIGNPLDGWPGEAWLDHRDQGVRDVMSARLDVAVDKNCDAVEPDNVDGYTNNSGFDLSGADQIDYNRFLAEEAHARGLSIGLKNDLEQIPELLDDFDWALDEECVTWNECELLEPFIDAGKAVFHVEYVDDPSDGQDLADAICPDALDRQFSTLVKEWDLGPWRIAC